MTANTQTIASLLGLKRPTPTKLHLAEAIEKGLPVGTVKRISHLFAPDDPTFSNRIVPRATLARRKKLRILSPEESDKAARLARLWALSVSVWKSDEDARRFLFEPHMLLNERAPIDVAQTAVGARMVEEILGRLEYGTYA